MTKVKRPLRKAGLAGAVSVMALQFMGAIADPVEPELVNYRIEAQPLARALMEYSEQSQIVVVVPSDILEGKTSYAVDGQLNHEAALSALLKGTGLKVERLANGALTLQRVAAEVSRRKRHALSRLHSWKPRRQLHR